MESTKLSKFGQYLDQKCINYRALCKKIGISYSTLHQHRIGKAKISLKSAQLYAQFFGMTMDVFCQDFREDLSC